LKGFLHVFIFLGGVPESSVVPFLYVGPRFGTNHTELLLLVCRCLGGWLLTITGGLLHGRRRRRRVFHRAAVGRRQRPLCSHARGNPGTSTRLRAPSRIESREQMVRFISCARTAQFLRVRGRHLALRHARTSSVCVRPQARGRLLPYLYTALREAHDTGVGLLRPM